ncbi:MAG: nucleotide sugar dehydrogenase [Petrotogales bacterium]
MSGNVCLFGLGRIGLPIAVVCADSGYRVTGVDINKDLIEDLRDGKVGFDEPGLQGLLEKHLDKRFFPKHQQEDVEEEIKKAEFIVVAVGTGFARFPDEPKLSTLYSIIGQLISVGIEGKTVILRVTLPVGTVDDVKSLIEKKTDLKEGEDFWLAFVPERLMEGKAIEEEKKLPKIIGAYNEEGFSKVSGFFEKIGGDLIQVSSPRTAEFIKLVDNSWRSTRFAFANELAFLAEEKGVDALEAIESANKGYERNAIPRPGPVSGYCLGKDPYLLELAFKDVADRRGFNSVWYYGRRANDWLVDKVIEEVEGKNILVAGLSFKEDIDDFRYSHGVEIVRRLVDEGYSVYVHDPYLDSNVYSALPDDLDGKVVKMDDLGDLGEMGSVVFCTRHKEYKGINTAIFPERVKIIDLWNLFREKIDDDRYEVLGLGR